MPHMDELEKNGATNMTSKDNGGEMQMRLLPCCVPVPIAQDELEDLVNQAKDYAISHGIIMRPGDSLNSPEAANYAPMTLLPSGVQRQCFEHAQKVQTDFNILMNKVANDYEFLRDCLSSTIKVDDFTAKLWEIYETIHKEGIAQPLSLGINRSDYMQHCAGSLMHNKDTDSDSDSDFLSKIQLKQIEFNTIAASFGGLSAHVTNCHRYILRTLGVKNVERHLPDNNPIHGLAKGIVTAWEKYDNPRAAVLCLVHSNEANIYDQRWVEYGVQDRNPQIKLVRHTYEEIFQHASLTDDKRLILRGREIAVVYFRSGYSPGQYFNQKCWDARLRIERSRAIKCPNICYQLAGTKKVQQVLATKGVIERFLKNSDSVANLSSTFVELYGLEKGPDGDRAIELAMQHPEKFVLKPQREGGGNNYFGEELKHMLQKIKDTEERNAYILMERIQPAPLQNYMVRVGQNVSLANMVSELGIFGIFIGNKEEVLLNEHCGHILRTKTIGTNEGGVATGYSALDSPYLID